MARDGNSTQRQPFCLSLSLTKKTSLVQSLVLFTDFTNKLREQRGLSSCRVSITGAIQGAAPTSWIMVRDSLPPQSHTRKLFFTVNWECLLAILRPFLQREDTRFRNCITPEKVLANGIYRLAHGGSYENAGVAMNVCFVSRSFEWTRYLR